MARWMRNDDGASAVEYGLLLAAVAAVIMLVVFTVGVFTGHMFNDTCDNIQTASPGPMTC